MVGCMSGNFLRRKKGIILILFCFFCLLVYGQTNQKTDDKDKKLKEEILAVYKSKGEEVLRDFVKKKKNGISNKFIVEFTKSGVNERKEEWLKISEIMAEEKKDEKTLADVYYRIGEYLRLTSNGKKALEYFEKALPIYLKLNDGVGLGNIYLKKGSIYYFFGDSLNALKMYDKAMTFFEEGGDLNGQGYVYFGKGDICFRTRNKQKALEMYNKALSFFEKIGDLKGLGTVYHRKGEVYFYIGDNTKALEMHDKSLTFFVKINDLHGEGNVYLSKGKVYLRKGDLQNSLKMFNNALMFYERAGIQWGQASVYLRKGYIYYSVGDNIKALEMYNKAVSIFKKLDDPVGQGNVYWAKGDIYFRSGDNFHALEMFEKALFFFEKTGDLLGQGNVYFTKGKIYLGTGALSVATKMLEKSMLCFEKAGNAVGKGNVYWVKGDIYLKTKDFSKALEMYDKALNFHFKTGNVIGQGSVYWSKGDIYFYNNDTSRALEMYDKALLFFKKAGNAIGQGNAYRRKGEVYFSTGDNLKALEMFEEALTILTKIDAMELVAYTLYVKALVSVVQGKKKEALTLFDECISKLEKYRAGSISPQMKIGIVEMVYKQYEDASAFMLQNKYYEHGFKYTESMKARAFLDRLAEGLIKLDEGILPSLRQKRDDLVSKFSTLSKEIDKAAGKQEEQKLKELKVQYRKVEEEFEELLVKIRLNNPMYASVRYPQPITVNELQDDVLKGEDLLLRYFIAKDKIYVFLISQDNFNVVTLEAGRKNIKNLAEQYLLAIQARNSREIRKLAEEFYRKLFKPLEASIKDRNNIIIVPDGDLAKIPFETFIVNDKIPGKPVYLLEKYRVKYIQSASALAILRKYYTREGQSRRFIGFGDPVYDFENFKQGKPEIGTGFRSPVKGDAITELHRSRYDSEGGKLNRLKSSGEEVNTIANLFKKQSQKCLVHLRQQANETNAKLSALKEFDYIHFACHAVMGDGFQSLVLSQLPASESTEDGYLTLNEIMNCDYNAKLVVLSACRTSKGKMERSEGVTGLTRAVMYAGTPAVVASLWDVEDIATKELMVKFYKNMLEKNMDKTEALRQAKLELLKNKKYASPLFWSAFVLYGE